MENFIYDTPTMVYFGKGEELNVGKYVAQCGAKKVLIHYGSGSAKKSGLLDKVYKALNEVNIPFVELGGVKANPELPLVRQGIELCKKENVDFVLAVGGGSVMDSSKAIANGVANPEEDVWNFNLGKAQPVRSLKKGCILTLSAAGSEMSNSCVITNPENGDKRGFTSHFNRMDFAIENPELTYTVDAYQTACGIVDIAMHTIERYFCLGEDSNITDVIAESLIKEVNRSGVECLKNPENYEARANMMWASSLAHNGLTGCGRKFQLTVHQLEHEVSGMYPEIAHGAGLAALWCSWARYVYKDCLNRFVQYAQRVWNLDVDFEHPEKTVLKAIDMQEDFYASIGMPVSLSELGVKEESLPVLAEKCSRGKTSILDGYKKLGYNEILEIYKMAF